MPLIRVTEAERWDAFIASQSRSQFTQSWAWGEFRISRGQTVERLALVGKDDAWEAAALFIHFPKPLVGGYWYAPRGPVIRNDLQGSDVLTRFAEALSQHRFSRPSLFWRIEPAMDSSSGELPASWVRSHAYMPASTFVIDLSADEEGLLKGMHEKTRYNIRVAERHGVTVREAVGPQAITQFLKLNDETAVRDRFVSQPSAYIKATHAFLSAPGISRLRFAEKDGNVLAASLEISFGDTVTYLYGASASAARNVMAPYALHWSAIRAAKAEGKRFYDFHGVNPTDTASPYYKKSWDGITRFKLGWGGERIDLMGTWELPQQQFLYHVLRTVQGVL